MTTIFWLLFSIVSALVSTSALRYLTGLSLVPSCGIVCGLGVITLGLILSKRLALLTADNNSSAATLSKSPSNLLLQATAQRQLAWAALGSTWIALVLVTVGSKGRTGLFSLYSQDVASHLAYAGEFIYKSGSIYHGFVGLYGTIGLLVQLFGLHTIDAIAFAIYGLLALSLLLMACPIIEVARTTSPRWLYRIVSILACTLFFFLLDLPLFFYNIGEGFWAHITSIVVLFGLWAGYTVVASARARISLAIVSILLYRFSYGLNLGDLVCTVSLIVWLEAAHLARFQRAMRLTAAALLAASVVCYYKLLPLAYLYGGVVQVDTKASIASSVVLIAGLYGALLYLRRTQGDNTDSPIVVRFLLFPIIFSSISTLAELTYDIADLPERYYSFKYGVHRVMVLSFAAPIALMTVLLRWTQRLNDRFSYRSIYMLVIAALVTGGSCGLYNCYKIYRLGMSPLLIPASRHFPDPLFSDAIAEAISTTLDKRGSTYHGTAAFNWSSVMFLNSFMLHKQHGEAAKELAEGMSTQGLTHPPPAACVFWIKDGYFRNPPPLPLEEVRASIASLEQRPDKSCFRARDGQGRRFSLCHVCGT